MSKRHARIAGRPDFAMLLLFQFVKVVYDSHFTTEM
jgi:hypothetical protein